MEKKLISKDDSAIAAGKERLEAATAELNKVLNDFFALGLSIKSEEEAIRLFKEPAALLVEKMDLKNNNLAKMMADDKILQLLMDQRPMGIVEKIANLKTAISRTIENKSVKFEKGGFVIKDEALKAIDESFCIFAETKAEIEVYEIIEKIRALTLDLHNRLKNDIEDPANPMVPLRAPFSFFQNGAWGFHEHSWKLAATRLKRK